MRARWEEYLILLLLIGRPLLIVTGVVGRPWCKVCASKMIKNISASTGSSQILHNCNKIFAVVWCGVGPRDGMTECGL